MGTHCRRVRTFLLLAATVTIALLLGERPVAAHPLDQLTQHLFIELQPTEVRFTVAINGGILANELVLSQLDADGDGQISPAEETAWLQRWTRTLRVTLDGGTVPVDAASIQMSMPAVEDFHIGLTPLLISFTAPITVADPSAEHRLAVRIDYLINRTTYRLDVVESDGTKLLDESWPGSSMRVAFNADPSVPASGNSSAEEAARQWSGGGVLAKARKALEHEKTPAFMIILLGIFALMGALHAMQPGHGKTLVAAYLVATGGTPRDAFVLAGIVTFTHTISVFALGLATLAASELFLPSKVIPVMGAFSGLLVALMGLTMLRGALKRIRHSHKHEDSVADHDHHDGHHHHHDHEHVSEEEHGRLHLEEALAIRRGVSRRNLITLGVSGGMAPCPDALAILLLAIWMNQAGLGMLAIVAFSIGLATVLVAFGLAVAMLRPAWSRARRHASSSSSRRSTAFGRLATAAPMMSATIVLLLGLAMTWRSIQVG